MSVQTATPYVGPTNIPRFPATGSFMAIFYTRYGDGMPHVHKKAKIAFKSLNEKNDLKSTKPAGNFRWKGGMYMWNPAAVQDFDPKGLPIIKYYEGQTEPFVSIVENLDRVNAVLFDKAFGRGEMRSVIAGSQKPKDEWDKKTLIVGMVMGCGIMYIVTSLLTAYGVHI